LREFPLSVDELEVTTLSAGYGYEPLQKRLARHTGAPEECIVAAAGTSMANHLAMAALLVPGDEVLIEQPTYGLLLDAASYLGARITRFERRQETGFALDVEEIERSITEKTRLIVLTNLHNPSGALVPAETLRALGELAVRTGAHVLIDEVYLEMLFNGDAPFSFPIGEALTSAGDNPFVITSSLTKVYGLSGLRCGWVLASPALAQRIWRLNDLFASGAAHTAERMSVIALDHLKRFRERTRSLLLVNRPLVDQFLDARSDLECFRPPAGTVVFPRLLHGNSEPFLELLRDKYETTVAPGRFFGMPEHFRLGIGGETNGLRVGLERLGDALDDFAP